MTAGDLFARTDFLCGDSRFPAFVTRRTMVAVRKDKQPSWAIDLVREYEADDQGDLVRETGDPEGARYVWDYRCDAQGRRISMRYPDGYFVQFRYNSRGHLIRTYRGNKSVKKARFRGGEKIREIEPNGTRVAFDLDPLRRVVQKSSRKSQIGSPWSVVEAYRFNAVGSKTYLSNEASPRKERRWDGAQRVVWSKEGGESPTRFSYRANGNSNLFLSTRFCESKATEWGKKPALTKYDALQRPIERRHGVILRFAITLFLLPVPVPFFFRLVKTWKYDAAGNLLEEWDGGRRTRYEYDALNRRICTHRPDGSWVKTLFTSTGLEYATVESNGDRKEKRFDSIGEEVK